MAIIKDCCSSMLCEPTYYFEHWLTDGFSCFIGLVMLCAALGPYGEGWAIAINHNQVLVCMSVHNGGRGEGQPSSKCLGKPL